VVTGTKIPGVHLFVAFSASLFGLIRSFSRGHLLDLKDAIQFLTASRVSEFDLSICQIPCPAFD